MTFSGDQNGGLARMLAGVHGWVARGGPEVGRDDNSKAPSSMPVHKSHTLKFLQTMAQGRPLFQGRTRRGADR